MYSPASTSMIRFPSQSSCSSSEGSDLCYTRSDEPCMFSFMAGDTVWTRANGVWSLGVVVYCERGQSKDGFPVYTVLTRVASTNELLVPVNLSPLFGSLKPANTYMASLLHAEGVFPLVGTDRSDVLDLHMRARAWLNKRKRDARMRRSLQ